jgi:hypothetical protein
MVPVVFDFHHSFYVGSGMKNVRIRIRDGKMFGSGVKHPGSAIVIPDAQLFLFSNTVLMYQSCLLS